MQSDSRALQWAVRSVLYTGAISALAVSPMAMAQDEGDEEDAVELGQQVVTGSRIKRIDLEQARPVVVITREEIELSGQESVADVLRNSPVNTFGSSREVSGSSWGGQATINLHGIGSTRSLVLLDGRRAPRSPVTANQANDLNWIPLAAVDRIEILTDSASAIYGSDAIGGVINVILRKDYDGLEAGVSLSRPTRDGADADSGVLTVGGSTNRGRFLFSADFYNKVAIASRQRSYSESNPGYDAGPVDYPNAPFDADWYDFRNTNNISVNGNTIWSPHFKSPSNCADVVDPDTGERLLLGPYIFPAGPSFLEFCGFDYAAVAWETQDIKRTSAFLHADYEISPDHAVRVQSMFSANNYHGRYAPPLGGFRLTDESAEGLKQSFDFDIPYPELLPYTLRHRFIGLGNRDGEGTNTIFETAVLAYGTVGMFDYELEARHQRYEGRDDSCCYAKKFTTEQYVAQGLYNPFDPLSPANTAAYAAITANATRDSRADFRSYSGNVSFELFETPAGPIGWAAGFDYFDESFRDIYDPLSEGGDLIGSAGNSGAGERAISALFAESFVPVLSNLEVSAAVRWDKYDDSAGNELSSYLSARYQPADWLLFRASWGEGFRAANMNNLYGALSVSYEFGTDLVACEEQGISPDACPQLQYATWTGGNPDLAPELSDSYNIGFVLDLEPVTVRMDYFTLKIQDGIGLSTLQGLIQQQQRGQCVSTGRVENTRDEGLPAEIIECGVGVQLKRDPGTGALLEAEAPWANTSENEYAGIDLNLRYDWETATAGDFTFSLLGTRMLEVRSRSATATTWSSSLGEGVGANSARPKYQAGGLIRWTYTDHTVSLYIRHTAGYVRPAEEFSAPSHTEYDLLYRWDTPWDGRITLGVRNLTDEDPELDPFADRPAVYDLYSLDGRVPYVSYRHFF